MNGLNKRKILIIHSSLDLGGAETSLLGLLDGFDYTKDDVDLFLLSHTGELMNAINPNVNLLDEIPAYKALTISIADCFKTRNFLIGISRLLSKVFMKLPKYSHCEYGYTYKQLFHKLSLPLLPMIKKEYDIVLSFIDPHFIAAKKVVADKKLGWVHFECSNKKFCYSLESEMWSSMNRAVCVSEKSKNSFDLAHRKYTINSCVIENLLSKSFVIDKSTEYEIQDMNPETINILSIGRYATQKNFDNVPDICRKLLNLGINCTWYIIGFGSDEDLIKEKIVDAGMEQRVILLGKKENPYPYIKACDLYVQPSRWEGKSVAVREAQMLGKTVVITDYPSASSQLSHDFDGIIVPLDNLKCAEGISKLLNDDSKMNKLSNNCINGDYTNSNEILKIYELLE